MGLSIMNKGKLFLLLVINAFSGLLGNQLASMTQRSVEEFLGADRLYWIAGCLGSTIILTFLLEARFVMPLNWWWHRYWLLREIVTSSEWKDGFGELELVQQSQNSVGTDNAPNSKRQDMISVLQAIVTDKRESCRRALIAGEPGSGKTTGLKRFQFEYAKKNLAGLALGKVIPVFVRFSYFQAMDRFLLTQTNDELASVAPSNSLLGFLALEISKSSKHSSAKALAYGIHRLVRAGHIALLLDGLDELPELHRKQASVALEDFLNTPAYGKTAVIITSRMREVSYSPFSRLQTFEIQALSDQTIDYFIETYSSALRPVQITREALGEHKLLEPNAIGRNPFWLHVILRSGVFRNNKGTILNDAVDALLNREVNYKGGVMRAWKLVLHADEQVIETKLGISWLAYRMQVTNQSEFDKDRAVIELGDWLTHRIGVDGLRPQDLLGLGRDAQVLNYESGPIRFRHSLLQQHGAAWVLATHETLLEESLNQLVEDTHWWGTLVILAGLISNPKVAHRCNLTFKINHPALVRSVLSDGTDDSRVMLALALLTSVENPGMRLHYEVMQVLAKSIGSELTVHHSSALAFLVKNATAGNELIDALSILLLSANTEQLQENAAELVGSIGSKYAIQTLASYMSEPDLGAIVSQVLEDIVSQAPSASATEDLVIEALFSSLSASSALSRRRAALVLREVSDIRDIRHTGAIEHLIEALSDSDPDVRSAVASALGRIGDSRAVEPLIRLLDDSEEDVSEEVVNSLGTLGDEQAASSLLGMLVDPDATFNLRLAVAFALGNVGGDQIIYSLTEIINDSCGEDHKDESSHTCLLAYIALAISGDERALPSLETLVHHEESWVRMLAVTGLRRLDNADALKPIMNAMKDTDPEVRIIAVKALREKKATQATRVLLRALNDIAEDVREEAAAAVGDIGIRAAVKPLIRLLDDPSEKVSTMAAISLGKLGDARSIQPLLARLSLTNPMMQVAAANVLGFLHAQQAVPQLVIMLDDSSTVIRLMAVQALGQVGDPTAAQSLTKALLDPSDLVRDAARTALANLGQGALDTLIDALNDPSLDVVAGVVFALGEIGNIRNFPYLVRLSENENRWQARRRLYVDEPQVESQIEEAIAKLKTQKLS